MAVVVLGAHLCLAPGFAIGAESAPSPVNHVLPGQITDFLKPAEVKPFGSCPAVTFHQTSKEGPRTYLIVLGKNDEIISALYKFAKDKQIKGAAFTGIGAVGCAALGFFDKESESYKVIKLPQQLELASLSGNIATKGNGYIVHAHSVVAAEDGKSTGGHLLYATAWPTVEIMLSETESRIEKRTDDETGLSLY
jgi:uncharacterized protein